MYKVTNKKTGFYHYFNAKEAAKFVSKNGASKYKVKEIKEFDVSEFGYMIIACLLVSFFVLGYIYFATN